MKTARVLYWRRGGILLGTGIGCIIAGSLLWENGHYGASAAWLMLAGLVCSAVGVIPLSSTLREVWHRELLKRYSLSVWTNAELVSKKRGRNRYYIYARCISPILCEEIWVSSPLLIEDPKPYLKNGVRVLFDPKYGGMYYMLVEELKR